MELTDEELLITSPILYAFSLSDKLWCECRIPVQAHHMADTIVQWSSTSTRRQRSTGMKRRSLTSCSHLTGRHSSSHSWRPTTRKWSLMTISKGKDVVSLSIFLAPQGWAKRCRQRRLVNVSDDAYSRYKADIMFGNLKRRQATTLCGGR